MAEEWEIVMPRLSDTMTEGVVSRWLKTVGDRVEKGEPVVEVETEKATLEIVAELEGFLVEIRAVEGSEAPTGARIGLVAAEMGGATQPEPASDRASNSAVEDRSVETADANAPAREARRSDPPRGDAAPADDADGRIRVSPIARKIARELGVDIASIGFGRGPMRRILRTDVERAARTSLPGDGAAGVPRNASRGHAAMARRMTASKQTIPHFYLSAEIDATRLERLREETKSSPSAGSISVTTLVVKACALALRQVPDVNSSWRNDGLFVNDQVNIGVAVALEDGGLVVPVILAADVKTPKEIQAELRRLSEKARGFDLSEADLSNGTFTVSNMGMLGVDTAYAIINPPQSGILAVGAVRQTLDLVAGEIVVGQVMTASLSGDHRAYSGATGAKFLGSLRECLENPISLFTPPE